MQSLVLVPFQGFDGLPVAGSRFFGSGYYTKSVAYIGVIAVALAAVAVLAAVKQRRHRCPEVVSRFGAVALVMGAIVYLPIVESFLDGLPLVGSRHLWRRAHHARRCSPLAVLAGLGAEVIVRSYVPIGAAVRRWCGGAFGVRRCCGDPPSVGIRSRTAPVPGGLDPRQELHLAGGTCRHRPGPGRHRGCCRPARPPGPARAAPTDATPSMTAGDLGAHPGGFRRHASGGYGRVGPAGGGVLVVCETAFLVTAGTPLWARRARPTSPPTRAEAHAGPCRGLLGRRVRGQHLASATSARDRPRHYNVAFGIKEFAVYQSRSSLRPDYGISWLQAATSPGSSPLRIPSSRRALLGLLPPIW